MGVNIKEIQGYRLINTKYPVIELFDDMSTPEDYDLVYYLQSLTNPRLQNEVGDLSLVSKSEVPFDCKRGRSYAMSPFTHINPQGGRFHDGLFGALYIADSHKTAIKEVQYHQHKYWIQVENHKFERVLFRLLLVSIKPKSIYYVKEDEVSVLDPDDYSFSQQLARKLKKEQFQCISYPSVRHESGICWVLLTPKAVTDIVQSKLIQMIWDGSIVEVGSVESV
ncbi:MAG: RES family NAD+ phosphorylase [Endozoicomonadaceae bacterium]|nr:RES family NAD+ phosphorylase [Endozoicomonadaceae bacterium]